MAASTARARDSAVVCAAAALSDVPVRAVEPVFRALKREAAAAGAPRPTARQARDFIQQQRGRVEADIRIAPARKALALRMLAAALDGLCLGGTKPDPATFYAWQRLADRSRAEYSTEDWRRIDRSLIAIEEGLHVLAAEEELEEQRRAWRARSGCGQAGRATTSTGSREPGR